jgi:uncharacterized protein (DUF1697 family)
VSVPVRYVAFLRAINVGGHVVKMAQLRKLFESIGLRGVETFIASGNVVFESSAKPDRVFEQKIEAHLEKHLGYAVGTFVRSIPELQAIAQYDPFKGADFDVDRSSLYVGFLGDRPSRSAAAKLNALRTSNEALHVHGRELYWISNVGLGRSEFTGAILEKTLTASTTIRSINTVRRLIAKYGA